MLDTVSTSLLVRRQGVGSFPEINKKCLPQKFLQLEPAGQRMQWPWEMLIGQARVCALCCSIKRLTVFDSSLAVVWHGFCPPQTKLPEIVEIESARARSSSVQVSIACFCMCLQFFVHMCATQFCKSKSIFYHVFNCAVLTRSTTRGAMAVKIEKVGRVARIILNQPEKMNAMTAQLVEDFGKVLESIHENAADFGAVLITGSGKAFSAGGDQKWLEQRRKDTPSRNSQIMHDFYHRFLAVRSLPLPVVAAINGPAVGAGMCLAMACDIRVAARTAKMGFPFVSLGLHPGMGATHMIASVAGYETAYRLLLTGDMVTGEEAKELRLVSQVQEDGPSAQAEALALAERIAAQSPVAVRTLVRSLRRKQEEGLEAALWREADARDLETWRRLQIGVSLVV